MLALDQVGSSKLLRFRLHGRRLTVFHAPLEIPVLPTSSLHPPRSEKFIVAIEFHTR